ncbi:SDR family oxidoreductase [Arthrobacter ulcerisalmonis]|uniref:SDR family oxidoreductase n=1 Tax=Arthrobacter ulcerisalmonis TaxID=2483813 RepID=UPI0036363B2F
MPRPGARGRRHPRQRNPARHGSDGNLPRPGSPRRRTHGNCSHTLGRIGQPDEIAKAALHLVSDEAGFTTGSSLLIDGGLTI